LIVNPTINRNLYNTVEQTFCYFPAEKKKARTREGTRDRKKSCGVVRADEERKWDEGPRGEVEGMETLISEVFVKGTP
jgi:hypothetical protein